MKLEKFKKWTKRFTAWRIIASSLSNSSRYSMPFKILLQIRMKVVQIGSKYIVSTDLFWLRMIRISICNYRNEAKMKVRSFDDDFVRILLTVDSLILIMDICLNHIIYSVSIFQKLISELKELFFIRRIEIFRGIYNPYNKYFDICTVHAVQLRLALLKVFVIWYTSMRSKI